ncbi:MAG: tRNA pseudouridine(38-40) synthase TruA [Oscillospiraceae bacterium]|nr:tRNA pseudouridine(38-40) synthase TruA [Oscillospiraceae bacterium]
MIDLTWGSAPQPIGAVSMTGAAGELGVTGAAGELSAVDATDPASTLAPKHNVAIRIMYDGSRYHGWQIQKGLPTVAGTLEAALARVCGHSVKLHGCGRTDAGVHALCYCANFFTTSSIPPQRLPLAVNTFLPSDISVQEAQYAPDSFEANLSCIKKEYTYKVYNSRIRDPFYASRAYFYPQKLDIPSMQRAAEHIVGTHDFVSLRSTGTVTKTTVRTVHWCEVETSGSIVDIRVCADGFLYNMARAIAGTLLYVSEGKILPDDIPALLEARDRRLAGPTAPPEGLYMTRIWYDDLRGAGFELNTVFA